MPSPKPDSDCKKGLIGVPKKSSPPLWWRFFFWPDAMGTHKVPEHLRSAGMYCPECRRGQPFSERCSFCDCDFACFVLIGSNAPSLNKLRSSGTFLPDNPKKGICHGLLSRLQAALGSFSNASLRARVIVLGITFLLLVSVVAGIMQHRSHLRRQYAQNYVRALYTIKSGMNLGEMICNGTFNAWRGVEPSTVPRSGTINPQALADLESVKTEIDKIMKKLDKPSAEYSQAARILEKLYALYEKTNSMVINSPDSLSLSMKEYLTAREEFSREIENLKSNLPLPLAGELKIAAQKYDLRFMAIKK